MGTLGLKQGWQSAGSRSFNGCQVMTVAHTLIQSELSSPCTPKRRKDKNSFVFFKKSLLVGVASLVYAAVSKSPQVVGIQGQHVPLTYISLGGSSPGNDSGGVASLLLVHHVGALSL